MIYLQKAINNFFEKINTNEAGQTFKIVIRYKNLLLDSFKKLKTELLKVTIKIDEFEDQDLNAVINYIDMLLKKIEKIVPWINKSINNNSVELKKMQLNYTAPGNNLPQEQTAYDMLIDEVGDPIQEKVDETIRFLKDQISEWTEKANPTPEKLGGGVREAAEKYGWIAG